MEPSASSLQKVRSQSDAAGSHTVIGFDEEARQLVDRLVGGRKQLQFMSVVGMAGLGKTTLVRKVFDEPSVVYHFYVRAWTSVTQEPRKRDLLLGILKSGFNDGYEDGSDMELSLALKRRLSGQRYLVVMDDIWDSKDWNDLMLCFPDDNVGSRIVFTSRVADVPLQIQPGCYQHPLRFLTDKESWDLLRHKVFQKESCPPSLVECGEVIARKCKGLPLSIVVIAGVLASHKTTNWWSQIAQDMNSVATNTPEEYMETLVLSYNHLPDHLKPCFLYFSAFPEDYEIPALKLILLWVAEGFIKIQTVEQNLEDSGNNLEEVAAKYLQDLVSRNLVIVSKSRSNGGIKSCIIHDILREFCIRKSDHKYFLHQVKISSGSSIQLAYSSFQEEESPHNAIDVGNQHDTKSIVKQLVDGRKQLAFISLVGDAGVGKKAVVKKVLNEPLIISHFYVSTWTTVRQEHTKREILLDILKLGFNAGNNSSNDMDLSETLKRRLSGKRYLFVLTVRRDITDLSDLMLCFPDDNVGSRIVFTTRDSRLLPDIQSMFIYRLKFLTEEESWHLFQHQVFPNENCPSSLSSIGKYITSKCLGMPLALVMIAGTLASDRTTNWWSQVAQDLSSIIKFSSGQYMEILELSYTYLPNHLKPCFVYFAAFPEDYVIPSWKLISLWVAEGLIRIQTTENHLKDEGSNLEKVAEGYLKELISRKLVMVCKSRYNGEFCSVHDVLRAFCIKKAQEIKLFHQMPACQELVYGTSKEGMVQRLDSREDQIFIADEINIFHQIPRFQKYIYVEVPTTSMAHSQEVDEENILHKNKIPRYDQYVSESETPTASMTRRLYCHTLDEKDFILHLKEYFHLITPSTSKVKTSFPDVQSILCCSGSAISFANIMYQNHYLFEVLRVFNNLRVMDLSSIGLSNIPVIFGSLLELRYISLSIRAGGEHILEDSLNLPTSILRLKYLETLIVHNANTEGIHVPKEIWMLCRLRHLILKGRIATSRTRYSYLPENVQTLSHLQTLSHWIPVDDCGKILENTPNLRKLGITAPLYSSCTKLTIPNLDRLKHLASLRLQNDLDVPTKDILPCREVSTASMFPGTLKELTLVRTFLKWDEMKKIEMLPNLEVLKLYSEAFCGEHWETNDGGFCLLKHLAFRSMKIVQWSAYSEQFPSLQHLKLDECQQLEEIPIGIGDIYTLEMIEINNCNPAVAQSAHKIREDQVKKGNDMLKISIFQA